jgi:hypothetical protein
MVLGNDELGSWTPEVAGCPGGAQMVNLTGICQTSYGNERISSLRHRLKTSRRCSTAVVSDDVSKSIQTVKFRFFGKIRASGRLGAIETSGMFGKTEAPQVPCIHPLGSTPAIPLNPGCSSSFHWADEKKDGSHGFLARRFLVG